MPGTLCVIDPSELLRPEAHFAAKPVSMFRDYSIDPEDPIKERVRHTYTQMHTNQTVDFVKGCHERWLKFSHFRSTIMDALIMLNDLVDESDPDVDIPNIPQWAVVGDTFPVGCAWGNSIVYRDTSFIDNPDGHNTKYNTMFGIYEPHCGLDNLMMSWGHDEYLYQVLKHNKTTIPEEGLNMIRFHSFYPWHAGGDYMHLCNEKDMDTLQWVLKFNKYDLYTKSEEVPDIEALKPYYQSLIDKYIPGVLSW
ncbi:Inositol oxygenase [Gryllus bimaculatus]|nr:Inositol oxygenase [Gryllus bimaculatus]